MCSPRLPQKTILWHPADGRNLPNCAATGATETAGGARPSWCSQYYTYIYCSSGIQDVPIQRRWLISESPWLADATRYFDRHPCTCASLAAFISYQANLGLYRQPARFNSRKCSSSSLTPGWIYTSAKYLVCASSLYIFGGIMAVILCHNYFLHHPLVFHKT
jgi:hypothetical protein